jgi:hypothetical protein
MSTSSTDPKGSGPQNLLVEFPLFAVILLLCAARVAASVSVAAAELLRYRARAWDDDSRSSV